MKTLTVLTAAALLAAGAAQAQVAYEVRTTSTTDVTDGIATTVQTQYVSTTTTQATERELPATNSVQVMLPSGEVLNLSDSSDAPWNKDSRVQGYDRFTWDPVKNVYIVGKGETKFESNWDENGNRVTKTTKKAVVKKTTVAPAAEAPVEAPAEDAPAQ